MDIITDTAPPSREPIGKEKKIQGESSAYQHQLAPHLGEQNSLNHRVAGA